MENKKQYDPMKLSDVKALTIKQAGAIHALAGVWLNHKAGVSMRRASVWISALKSDATTQAQAMAEIKAWKQALTGQVQPEKNRTEQAIAAIKRDLAESVKVDRELAKRPALDAEVRAMRAEDTERWEAAAAKRVAVAVKQNDAPARPVRFDPLSAALTPVVAKTPAVGVTVGQRAAEPGEVDQKTTENARLSLLERKRRAMEALAN